MSVEYHVPMCAHGPWRARLELQFERSGARTRLTRRRHEGPLLVQRAFYPEAQSAGPCHVYIIHPPGGMVSGDELELAVRLSQQAQALLTTAAAGKFYRSADAQRVSRLTQRLEIDGGRLEWLPLENIFFPDVRAELCTRVQLAGDARFIGWEIGCLGLPANRLGLGQGEVLQGFELWREGRPLLLERMRLDSACAAARWGLAGRAAIGSALAYPAGAQLLELARNALAAIAGSDMTLACTLVEGVLCCRAQAPRTDRLRQAFIELWGVLRPGLLGRSARPPRIWAT